MNAGMTVDESAVSRAALDLRLQVDRLIAIDPLRAILDPAEPPRQGERPAGGASLPAPPAPAPQWSSDALRLQALAGGNSAAAHEGGAVRFDVPLLLIESRASDAARTAPVLAPIVPSVAHTAADLAVGGTPAPTVRQATEGPGMPPVFVPLVLQGPAWTGQPMELIVRRERADETLDNPALDHWCGEVVIDLPELGRVAGHLAFSMQGLRVRLDADDEPSVARLTAATAELAQAFAGIDLRVSGLSVGRPAADAMRSDAPLSLHRSTRADFAGAHRGAA